MCSSDLPTAEGRVWFKAVFPLFRHEPAVTALLDRTVPGSVPGVIGRDDHEGWLLLHDVPGVAAADIADADAEVIASLIAIQHRFVDRVDELEAAGAPARPFATLADELAAAFADPEVRGWLDRPETRLDELQRAVGRAAAEVTELGIPDTLVHGDFHAGNVLVADGAATIIDWSDAAIAHPLVDALTWMNWFHEDPDRGARAWAAFRDGWAGFCPAATINHARSALTVATTAYHVVSYVGIVRGLEPLRRPELLDGLQHYLGRLDEAVGS